MNPIEFNEYGPADAYYYKVPAENAIPNAIAKKNFIKWYVIAGIAATGLIWLGISSYSKDKKKKAKT